MTPRRVVRVVRRLVRRLTVRRPKPDRPSKPILSTARRQAIADVVSGKDYLGEVTLTADDQIIDLSAWVGKYNALVFVIGSMISSANPTGFGYHLYKASGVELAPVSYAYAAYAYTSTPTTETRGSHTGATGELLGDLSSVDDVFGLAGEVILMSPYSSTLPKVLLADLVSIDPTGNAVRHQSVSGVFLSHLDNSPVKYISFAITGGAITSALVAIHGIR